MQRRLVLCCISKVAGNSVFQSLISDCRHTALVGSTRGVVEMTSASPKREKIIATQPAAVAEVFTRPVPLGSRTRFASHTRKQSGVEAGRTNKQTNKQKTSNHQAEDKRVGNDSQRAQAFRNLSQLGRSIFECHPCALNHSNNLILSHPFHSFYLSIPFFWNPTRD